MERVKINFEFKKDTLEEQKVKARVMIDLLVDEFGEGKYSESTYILTPVNMVEWASARAGISQESVRTVLFEMLGWEEPYGNAPVR